MVHSCSIPAILVGRRRMLSLWMALDVDRNIYLTGGTRSSTFPVINAIQPELKGRMRLQLRDQAELEG
jgi:hypothetical protein